MLTVYMCAIDWWIQDFLWVGVPTCNIAWKFVFKYKELGPRKGGHAGDTGRSVRSTNDKGMYTTWDFSHVQNYFIPVSKKKNIIINIIKYSLFLYMCLAGETFSLLINEVKIVRKNI